MEPTHTRSRVEKLGYGLTLLIGIILIGVSIYFFVISIGLMAGYQVAAALLSALIGFTLLSAGTTILRSWIISRAAGRSEGAGAS